MQIAQRSFPLETDLQSPMFSHTSVHFHPCASCLDCVLCLLNSSSFLKAALNVASSRKPSLTSP